MNLQELSIPKAPASTAPSDAKDMKNGESELKSFTFRNIPPNLHKLWKTCSAIADMTMEEFALAAIQKYVTDIMGGKPETPPKPQST